jgi:ribosome-associated protein
MEFKLQGPFIDLDNLIKNAGWAPHGAAAKELIRQGAVRVNGQPESRVRRKLRPGDTVTFQGHTILLVA